MKTIFTRLLIILLIFGMVQQPAQALSASPATQASGTPGLPLMFGAYTSVDLQTSVNELTSMDNWLTGNGASGVTFAGDFLSITWNPGWNVEHELEAAWNNGFVPFINLMPSESWENIYFSANCDTTADIAAGLCDSLLTTWIGDYKTWVNKGGGRFAFIAPLPEVNGNWITYASNGSTYINAFKRVRQLFEAAGVTSDMVRWVFAPNGWNDPAYPWQAFENYYPGDAYVDVVAFSSYNYGGCPADSPWRIWDVFETALKPYLDRMRVMAPNKPIFISQTGTVNVPDDPSNPNETKSNWIKDTFGKLADYPNVRGIIYFNKVKAETTLPNCPAGADYVIYDGTTNGNNAGFLEIMKDSRLGKWAPGDSNWTTVPLTDEPFTFDDVANTYWASSYIDRLYNAKITGGCTTSPLNYCPEGQVTRAQMAVFLEKGMAFPTSFNPPNVTPTFTDTVGHWAEDWIEALKRDGVTSGCAAGLYCPEDPVTRAQMALFLLKAKHGSSYSPPPATGVFTDVPVGYWADKWIEQLAAEGITGGCDTDLYCPNDPVTRAQMAVFLVKTFGLP
jgi:hypothetical protein